LRNLREHSHLRSDRTCAGFDAYLAAILVPSSEVLGSRGNRTGENAKALAGESNNRLMSGLIRAVPWRGILLVCVSVLLVMSAVLWFFGLVSPETTGLWNTIYDEAPETYATLQGLFSPAG